MHIKDFLLFFTYKFIMWLHLFRKKERNYKLNSLKLLINLCSSIINIYTHKYILITQTQYMHVKVKENEGIRNSKIKFKHFKQ
jgi:hypothetical protein